MNMTVRDRELAKPDLERMVLSYLRMFPGTQHIERVVVAPRASTRGNWTVVEIEPALSTSADNEARNALVDLQRDFRLKN